MVADEWFPTGPRTSSRSPSAIGSGIMRVGACKEKDHWGLTPVGKLGEEKEGLTWVSVGSSTVEIDEMEEGARDERDIRLSEVLRVVLAGLAYLRFPSVALFVGVLRAGWVLSLWEEGKTIN